MECECKHENRAKNKNAVKLNGGRKWVRERERDKKKHRKTMELSVKIC